jgi:gliding motility-associated-like protein
MKKTLLNTIKLLFIVLCVLLSSYPTKAKSIAANRALPTVSLSMPLQSNSSSVSLTITCSEAVTGLTADDFVLSGIPGAYVDNSITFTPPYTYTATVRFPAVATGVLSVSLPANMVINAGGEGNVAAPTQTITVDNVGPVVTAVRVPTGREYKTGDDLDFEVAFTEPVYMNPIGSGMSYLPITIGTKRVLIPFFNGNGWNSIIFRYTIQPGDQDLDGIEIDPALIVSPGNVQDAFKNNANLTLNNIQDTKQVLVNASYPSVNLSGPSSSMVKGTFNVMAVFSDFVSGFTASDFVLTNVTASEPQTSDNVNFFIDFTPITDGPVSILLPANAVVNSGPNGNTASNQIDLVADLTRPTITQLDVPANGKYGTTSSLDFVVHFSEDVNVNTNNGDPSLTLNIGGKTVVTQFTSWVGNDALSFSYKIEDGDTDMDGIVLGASLLLNGASIRDAARNNAVLTLPAGIDLSGVTVNTVRPTVVLTSAAPPLVNNPFTIEVEFSEPVTGFSASSFALTNLYVDDLQTTDNKHYTVVLAANTNGVAKVSIPVDQAVNAYSSGNVASNELSFTADYVDPKIIALGLPVNGIYGTKGVLNFKVILNETVIVTTTGGTPYIAVNMGAKVGRALYVSGSGTNALTFSYPVEEGDMDLDGISLGAAVGWGGGRIQDQAGNDFRAALPANVSAGITINTTRPTVTLSTTAPATVKDPFEVTIVFSEAVTDLTAFDFILTNANVTTPQTTDDITYKVWVTPGGNGPVSVSLPADIAVNALQNGNTASNQLSFTGDFIAPVITQIDLPANGYYHTGDVLTFTVHFSENVVINTTNGTYYLPIHINTWIAPAYYTRVFGPNTMTFTYTVRNGDMAVNGLTFDPKLVGAGNESIKDASGNDANINLPVTDGSGVIINTLHPDVTLTTSAGAVVNNAFTVTAVFTEAVTGLTATDFTVSNATVSNLATTDNITYTFIITPTADGAVSVSLPADAALSTAGNGNTVSNTISVTADATVPVVTSVNVPANGYYNASGTLSFIVIYGEDVVVNATGGTPSFPVTIGGAVVQAQYTGGSGTSALTFEYAVQNGDADMDGIEVGTAISLNGGNIKDVAGNVAGITLNNIATTAGVFVNTTRPTVTLSTTAPPVLNSTFTVTAVFSEAVTGLTLGGFHLVNATPGLLQTNDNITYTIEISPMISGPVSVTLAANEAVNVGQNGNTASNQIDVTADFKQPKVTQVDIPANGYYNATKTLTFTVHFDENVDVNIAGGVALMAVNMDAATVPVQYVSGSGTKALTFSYVIQDGDMDIDGIEVGPAIALGGGATIQDAAGNNANPIFPNVIDASGIFINTAHPGVTLSSTVGSVVNTPFTVTAIFTEAVTGLTAADFTATNATVSDLQTTDNITYTVLVTPTANGAVSISLPADVAINVGSNGNTASNALNFTADKTAPVVTQVNVPANGYYKAGSTLDFTVAYNENVVVNGSPYISVNIGGTNVSAAYTGGTGTQTLSFRYTVQNGEMDMDGISIGANLILNGATIRDNVNNDAELVLNNIAVTNGVFVNTTHPTVTLSSTATNVNSGFMVAVVFSEVVTGLTLGDFSLTNATVGSMSTADNRVYAVRVVPIAEGPVSITLPADAAVNIGGNGNTAGNTVTVMVDKTAPIVTQVSVPANGYYKAGSTLNFMIHYSENVVVNTTIGTPAIGINIGATTLATAYTGGSGTQVLTFSYTVKNGDMDMDGIFVNNGMLLNGGTIIDAANNWASLSLNNIAATSNVFVNTAHPTVTLSTTTANVNAPFTVTAVFSEAVSGLTIADFSLVNATAATLQTTDNITYTIEITPATDGAVSILLPADIAVNIGDNGNTASNTVNVTADMNIPVVTAVSVPANGYYKAGSILNFTVNYSEPVVVSGTPILSVNIGGTIVSAAYTGGTGTQLLSFSYTVQNGEMDMDGISLGASLSLNGASIRDASNNNAVLTLNNVAATTGVFVNTTHPAVTLSTGAAIVNTSFTLTAVFSEAVTGLSATDFVLANATAGTLQTTDNITYTIDIAPIANGPVVIYLPAGIAVNIGNNDNIISNTLRVTADIVAPVITQVNVPVNGYYRDGNTLDFRVTFNEPVVVNTTGGDPSIKVIIGGAVVDAAYTGGSGTQSLAFSYTVQYGDTDMDGISLGVNLALNGAQIRDAAGNDASPVLVNVAPTNGIFVNTAHPAVTLSTVAATVTTPFTVTAVFSEAVTGLTITDFTVNNATVGNLQTTDNITYTLLITPVTDGAVTVSLPADVAFNIGNNGNTISNNISVTADMTSPVVTQVSVPANGYYKAASILSFAVEFSENVLVNTTGGTPAININIGGSTVTAVYAGGTGTRVLSFNYTVKNGDLDMDGVTLGTSLLLNGGSIRDAAGNNAQLNLNNIAATTGVLVNTIHPGVTLSTVAAGIVNAPFTVTAVFSEAVTGLTAADFSLTNATAAALQTTDNITYTIEITPTTDGIVSVSLPADVAVNIGDNGNTSSNTITVTADVAIPVVTAVSVPANGYYKAGSTLGFTVKYSEPVIVNGTPAITVNIGGNNVSALYTGATGTQLLSFTYTVQNGDMDMDGITVGASLSLNGASIKDASGNNAQLTLNNVGATAGVFVNTAHPSVVLSTTASTVNAPFTVTAVFSEAVTGFTATDFTISNATASNLQTADNITYTVTITPTADGALSVALPADVAVNIGGNGNTASNILSITADISIPVITQVSVPANGYYKAGSTLSFTVKYSEPVMVNGTPAITVSIGGNNVSALYTGGTGTQLLSFTYTVKNGDMDMDGITLGNSISLNGASIKDAAGNNAELTLNNVGATNGVFVNTAHPSVTLSTTASTVNAPFTVTAVFSEAVTRITTTDFTISNATASNLQTTDNITYTVTITPTADGAMSVALPADVAVNIGGNGNTASNILSITADISVPLITQVSVPANGYYKAGSTLSFTVKYSEPVIVNGTPAITVNIGGNNVSALYTGGTGTQLLSFTYTVQNGDMDMDGITLGNSISLNGASIKDAAGNNAQLTLNNVGATAGVFVNTAHPSVVLSTTASTVNAPFTVNAVFSEAVTGFTAIDFTVSNATVSNLQTTDNITYTVTVTPTADGAVSVGLPANVVVNIGGNGNTASNILSITADISVPVITQVSVPANGYYKAGSTLSFTVKYSEPVIVNGTPAITVNIGGNNVSALYTGGTGTQLLSFTYTVQNGDMDMDGITVGNSISLNGASIKDAAGNNAQLTLNNVGATAGVFVNTAHPSVTLSTTASTVNAPFTVTAVFSEAVTGFTATDFTVSNATTSNLQTADNITYTVTITPTADGAVSVGLPANVAVNIGSNGNTAANTLSVTADLTAPVITTGQTFSVNEHSPVGTTVGSLIAIETMGTLQHWTITSDGSGGAFAINPATGIITVKDMTILDSKVNTTVTIGVTVSDGLNTSATQTVNIRIVQVSFPPTDITINNNTVNERNPVGTLVGTLSAVNTAPAVTFTYSLVTGTGSTDNSSFRIAGAQLQTAAILNYGVMSIRVRATGSNGLSIEKVLTIIVNQVNQAPVMDVINDQRVCNVSDVQTLQVTGASPVEAGQTLTYQVTSDQPYFNSLTVNATGLIAYSMKPGISGDANITVTIKDNGGTANGGVDVLQRSFKLTVNSLPVVAITSDKGNTINKGDVITLTATGGVTYSWANANGIISGQQDAVLKAKPLATATYQVNVTNANSCSSTGNIIINVGPALKVDATNILTPNGDGKNDRWVVNNLGGYPDNEVTIYDRAGRVVYHRRNYSNDWDGTVNGNPLAEGTYYYILTIKDNGAVKGFITIIRDK